MLSPHSASRLSSAITQSIPCTRRYAARVPGPGQEGCVLMAASGDKAEASHWLKASGILLNDFGKICEGSWATMVLCVQGPDRKLSVDWFSLAEACTYAVASVNVRAEIGRVILTSITRGRNTTLASCMTQASVCSPEYAAPQDTNNFRAFHLAARSPHLFNRHCVVLPDDACNA